METKKTFRAAGKLCLIFGATLTVQGLVCQPLFSQTGKASWYSIEACQFNPDPKCPTASGKGLYELEKEEINFAAGWDWRFGQHLRIINLGNGKSVEVIVFDRGPNKRLGRAIDLSKKAFQKIAPLTSGVINVSIEVMP